MHSYVCVVLSPLCRGSGAFRIIQVYEMVVYYLTCTEGAADHGRNSEWIIHRGFGVIPS